MDTKPYPEKPILCVDDHEFWLVSLEALLSKYCNISNVVACSNSNDVLPLLAEKEFSLVLLDYEMPDVSGEELLPQIVNLYPETPVIVLTGHDNVELAVRCMELGASSYFVKTDDQEELANFIQQNLLSQEVDKTKSTLTAEGLPSELVDEARFISPAMLSVFSAISMTANDREPLTLVGEEGVGKHMLAETLLKLRSGGEFFEIDAVQQDGLDCFDSERVNNLNQRTKGGVVYINHLEAADQDVQREVLTCLQAQNRINGKIVVGLKEMPGEMSKKGTMRSDLANFLQLNLIEIPPLRDRKEDIPFLTQQFLTEAAERAGKKVPATPIELDLLLKSYHFPGNVRELKEMVYTAIDQHGSRKLSMNSFKQAMEQTTRKMQPTLTFSETLPTIEQAIDLLIMEAEKRAQGNQSIMANMLGISRPALNKRLQKFRQAD